MNLEWYALPMLIGQMFEVGGLQFPAAPFSGWYSSTEIVRDLVEENRYPGQMKVQTLQCSVVHSTDWFNQRPFL